MSRKSTENYDVAVLGGGAAGMMAAAAAAKQGAHVVIIEKNKRCGQKLAISGGGRCNILNAEEDTQELLANYGKAKKFLFSAFSRFGVHDTIEHFASIGIPIKIEARKRAFPESESAKEVVAALYDNMIKNAVTVMAHTTITDIVEDHGVITHIETSAGVIIASTYILATGGNSRPETGSTGDGFGWLAKQGHNVRKPTPNVTPLKIAEPWVTSLAGTTLQDVSVSFYSNGIFGFKADGSILFTHFGISGPTILNNAYRVAELLEQGEVTATIDCFPKLSLKELDDNIQEVILQFPAKNIKNSIGIFSPAGLQKAILSLLEDIINIDTNNSELSKINRLKIVNLLKGLPLTIEQLMGFEKAVVADGGVSLQNVDTRSMQSKIIKNLYITGDLLDINRPSGGFSLQLCWTTGHISGINAAATSKLLLT